jgi:parallel beta-helix repeat protein
MRVRAPGRVLACFLFLLALALGFQSDWASPDDGPIFIVDANSLINDRGNHGYHYRTLTALFAPHAYPKPGEHDTVLVAPGVYSGDLVITAKGLILRSTDGPEKTVIRGQVTINAEDVRLIGFSIDPGGSGPGVTIARDDAQLVSNEIRNGTIGVLIGVQSGSQRVELRSNQIFNNSQDGLSARDARDLQLLGNQIRGNGGAGALLSNLQGALIEKNTITFNRLGGLQLWGSDQVQIRENTISDNMLAAIMLSDATGAAISHNELNSNEIGVFLLRSSTNRVIENQIRRNRAGGIFIRDDSRENVVQQNQIEDNAGWGAPGVWLVGEASANEISQNSLLGNGVGLLLTANLTESPHGNILSANQIGRSDAEGVRVEASSGRNVWQKNEIFSNNGTGITLLAGSDEMVAANQIHDNGAQGIEIQSSSHNLFQGNRIEANGDDGLAIQVSPENVLQANVIRSNARNGLELLHADGARLLGNTLEANRNEGLYAQASSALLLEGNIIRRNGARGLYLQEIASVDLQDNEIAENSWGGVLLSQVRRADLEGNRILSNTQFGLEALLSPTVNARRNWWGDPRGPAGAFSGAGNAVIGLPLDQVVPWLPTPSDQLVLASVASEMADWPRGNRIQFDASDRADVDLDVYLAPALAQTTPLTASRTVLIAAKLSGPPPGAPPLENAIKFVSVQVQGLKEGTAQLVVLYHDNELPIGVRTADLRLYRLENGQWQALPSEAQPLFRRVSAELPLSQLQGEPLAIATGLGQQTSSAATPDGQAQHAQTATPDLPDPPAEIPNRSAWGLLAYTVWLTLP